MARHQSTIHGGIDGSHLMRLGDAERTCKMILASPKDRKDIWTSIFLRKGKNGAYTRLFNSLEPSQQHMLLDVVGLRDTELAVIGSVQNPEKWLVVTTERVVWSIGGNRNVVAVGEISHIKADIPSPEAKKNLHELQIVTMTGKTYLIELEPGAPLMGVWNVLVNMARRNRTAMKQANLN